MNIEKLNQIADAIEKAGDTTMARAAQSWPWDSKLWSESNPDPIPQRFYMPMTRSVHACGTAGCIAGFGLGLFVGEAVENDSDKLLSILDLSKSQALAIFDPSYVDCIDAGWERVFNHEIKARHAVKFLRSLQADDSDSIIMAKWRRVLREVA